MYYPLRETEDYDRGGGSSDEGDYNEDLKNATREKQERSRLITDEFKKRKGNSESSREISREEDLEEISPDCPLRNVNSQRIPKLPVKTREHCFEMIEKSLYSNFVEAYTEDEIRIKARDYEPRACALDLEYEIFMSSKLHTSYKSSVMKVIGEARRLTQSKKPHSCFLNETGSRPKDYHETPCERDKSNEFFGEGGRDKDSDVKKRKDISASPSSLTRTSESLSNSNKSLGNSLTTRSDFESASNLLAQQALKDSSSSSFCDNVRKPRDNFSCAFQTASKLLKNRQASGSSDFADVDQWDSVSSSFHRKSKHDHHEKRDDKKRKKSPDQKSSVMDYFKRSIKNSHSPKKKSSHHSPMRNTLKPAKEEPRNVICIEDDSSDSEKGQSKKDSSRNNKPEKKSKHHKSYDFIDLTKDEESERSKSNSSKKKISQDNKSKRDVFSALGISKFNSLMEHSALKSLFFKHKETKSDENFREIGNSNEHDVVSPSGDNEKEKLNKSKNHSNPKKLDKQKLNHEDKKESKQKISDTNSHKRNEKEFQDSEEEAKPRQPQESGSRKRKISEEQLEMQKTLDAALHKKLKHEDDVSHKEKRTIEHAIIQPVWKDDDAERAQDMKEMKHVADTVVKYLTPYYKEGRFSNKELFKAVAKAITHRVREITKGLPTSGKEEAKRLIREYMDEHGKITDKTDLNSWT